VLAADLGGGARLTREAFDQLGMRQRFGAQKLQRHHLAQLDVAGGDDVAHTAAAEQPGDLVLARDHVTDSERNL